MRGIREILLHGVFWRILVIEIILLIGSVFYRMVSQNVSPIELLWYALRIMALVVIILTFMMITLRRFLEIRIIKPLEIIADANLQLDGQTPEVNHVPHCFSDMYANVLSVENSVSGWLHHLGITYMDQSDKTLLGRWMQTAAPGSDDLLDDSGQAAETEAPTLLSTGN